MQINSTMKFSVEPLDNESKITPNLSNILDGNLQEIQVEETLDDERVTGKEKEAHSQPLSL